MALSPTAKLTLKRIRRIWRRASNPLRRLWNVALDARGPCRKAQRFGNLAVWARKKRDNRRKGTRLYKLWDGRRGVYRRKSKYYQEKCKKRQSTTSGGGSGCTSAGDPCWGGCRAITDEVIRIVGSRARVTSRKRSWGTTGSDHNTAQRYADAVDFGIGNAFSLRNEIMRKLGVTSSISDYAAYYITRGGLRYRIQPIASTHGTGPHLHIGVKRA